MKFNQPSGPKVPDGPGLQKSEKMRLIVMSIGLLLVVGAFLVSIVKSSGYEESAEAERSSMLPVEEEGELVEAAQAPEIDATELDGLVADTTRIERVTIEPDALDVTAGWARRLVPRHYESLGAPTLASRADLDALVADPDAHRAAPFRFRGGIADLRKRTWSDGDRDGWLATAQLEDGSQAFFFALELEEAHRSIGPFLRFDGLFLKVLAVEGPDGWVEAPLFVGSRPVTSYRAIDEEIDLEASLASVTDDGLGSTTGLPFLPNWTLMGYVAGLDDATVDWESAPVLDKLTLAQVGDEGDRFRGQPVKIPISKIMGLKVKTAGENPARIEEYTEGWIGNTTWKDLIQFKMPGAPVEGVEEGRLAYARGFFLKNVAYEPLAGGLHVAPYFVLSSLEPHDPPPDKSIGMIFWGVSGVTLFLTGLFFFLLQRDRRRSEQLQAELVRRRRARRQRGGEGEVQAAGAEGNA